MLISFGVEQSEQINGILLLNPIASSGSDSAIAIWWLLRRCCARSVPSCVGICARSGSMSFGVCARLGEKQCELNSRRVMSEGVVSRYRGIA